MLRRRSHLPPKCVENNWLFNLVFKFLQGIELFWKGESFNRAKWITLIVVNLYCLEQTCVYVEYCYRHREELPNTSFLNTLVNGVKLYSATYFINVCSLNTSVSSKWLKVLNLCYDVRTKLHLIMNIAVTIAILAAMTSTTLSIIASITASKSFVELYLFDWNYLQPPWLLTYIVSGLDVLSFHYALFLTLFAQAALTFTVECVRMKVHQLANEITTNSDVKQLCEKHTELVSAIQDLNVNFQNIFFLWSVEWIAVFCLNVPFLMEQMRYSDLATASRWAVEIINSLFSAGVLFATLAIMSCTRQKLISACHLRVLRRSGDLSDEDRAMESYLLAKLNTGHLNFTFLKCVVIDQSSLGSVATAVVSYLIFILSVFQVENKAVSQLHSSINCTKTD